MENIVIAILSGLAPYFFVSLISGLKELAKHNTQDAPIAQIMFAFFYGLGWFGRAIRTQAI